MSLQDAMRLPIETQVRRWVIAIKRCPKDTRDGMTIQTIARTKTFLEWCIANKDLYLEEEKPWYRKVVQEASEYALKGKKT